MLLIPFALIGLSLIFGVKYLNDEGRNHKQGDWRTDDIYVILMWGALQLFKYSIPLAMVIGVIMAIIEWK